MYTIQKAYVYHWKGILVSILFELVRLDFSWILVAHILPNDFFCDIAKRKTSRLFLLFVILASFLI